MTINVDIGGGQIVEFPDVETAQQYMNAQQQQDVERFGERGSFERLAAQAGVGSQFGIANMLGLPVDAVAGALSGIGEMTGLYGPIEAPVGGSEFFSSLMEPIRQDVPDPTTRGERVARRVGEEVGAAAAGFPLAFASPAVRAAPVAGAAIEGAAALGSGLGAAGLQEAFPESTAANVIGALGGGLAVGGAAGRLAGLGGRSADIVPGMQSQRDVASDIYSQVRADTRVMPSQVNQQLSDRLTARMTQERLNPRLQTGSANIFDSIITDLQGPMRIEDLENLRRMTTANMPQNASRADRRLGQVMRQEITDFLDELNDPTADLLREGRDAYRRASAAETVSELADKALRRAASTGTGGNDINTLRQNLNRILDNRRLRSSFTQDELDAMRRIVEGSTSQNLLRRLSRLAPSGGGLSSMLSIGGAMANPFITIPIVGAAETAKLAGQRSTRQAYDALLQQLAPDRVIRPSEQGATGVLRGLLGARTIANQE
jgi:hypothetical protein